MAIKTQLRMTQMSGSFPDLVYSGSQSSAKAAASVNIADMAGILGQFAGAIGRITGKDGEGSSAFTNQAKGHLSTDLFVTGSLISLNQAAEVSTATGNITVKSSDADVLLSANSGDVTLQDAGTSYLKFAADGNDAVITPAQSNKDVIFKEDGGNEIARFDSSSESLLMATSKKIEFRDTNTFIQSSTGNQLDLSAAANIVLDAAGDIHLDADGADVKLLDGGTAYLVINQDGSGNAVLSSSVNTKDIIFHGDGASEVARIDGSAKSLLVASDKKVEFRDTGLFINSSANGQLDIDADTELEITAPTVDINASTKVDISGRLDVGGVAYFNGGSVQVAGDLNVLGSTTTVSSSNTEFVDSLIGLNYSGATAGPNRDLGFVLARTGGNKAFFWDESTSMFQLGATANTPADSAVAISKGHDLGLANIQLYGATGNFATIMASGSSNAILVKKDASEVQFTGNIIMSGTTLNGDASEARTIFGINTTEGHTITLGGGARVTAAGKLRVDGGVIEDSGGDSRIAFPNGGDTTIGRADGTTAVTVNGANSKVTLASTLEIDGNKIMDSAGNVMSEYDGSNKHAISGSSAVKLVTPTLDVSMQQLEVKLKDNDADALSFKDTNGTAVYINYEGVEVQGGTNGDRSFRIYDGSANSLVLATDTGTYGNLTGSYVKANTVAGGSEGAYLQLYADGVTGSAGNTMYGGLFFSGGDFDAKTVSYNWSAGLLFASGTADYNNFVTEFGASATVLSALTNAAGGSAIRNDTVASSQVAANATMTLNADLSGVPESSADQRVQVFVNGQLMMSGSSNDYILTSYGSGADAKFQFIIEPDDVVTVLAS